MKQTALYYPAFIPSEQWIKDSLLYWDRISSIVPARHYSFSQVADLDYLRAEGLYEHVDPERAVSGEISGRELTREFIRKAADPAFADAVVKNENDVMYMSLGKTTREMERFVESRGWILDRLDYHWLVVPSAVGLLYVSLLAKYVAENERSSFLTPCTDSHGAQVETFSDVEGATEDGIQLLLDGLMPKTHQDTSLRSIVEFRQEHEAQLIAFRAFVRDRVSAVSTSQTWTEFKDAVSRMHDELAMKDVEFQRLMGDLKDDATQNTFVMLGGFAAPPVIGAVLKTLSVPASGGTSLMAGLIGGTDPC